MGQQGIIITKKTTRTVTNKGKKKEGQDDQPQRVNVASYTRVVNGKTVEVDGYSYTRK